MARGARDLCVEWRCGYVEAGNVECVVTERVLGDESLCGFHQLQ